MSKQQDTISPCPKPSGPNLSPTELSIRAGLKAKHTPKEFEVLSVVAKTYGWEQAAKMAHRTLREAREFDDL